LFQKEAELALKLAYVGGPLTFAISLVDLQPLYVILFFACPPGLLRIEKREKQAVLALAKTYTSAVADCAVVVRRFGLVSSTPLLRPSCASSHSQSHFPAPAS